MTYSRALPTLLFTLLLALTGCTTPVTPVDQTAYGRLLAEQMLIVDTHIDVPYRLEEKPADVSIATRDGDFDYPRAKAGGLNVPFMSIYIPAEKETEGTAKTFADGMIDQMEALAAHAPDKFALASSTAEVSEQFDRQIISLAFGMENGAPLEGSLDKLRHFYDRGIRYITLTHSKSNHICDSSYDENRPWAGLSPFGETLIPAMNNIGVMIDISHVSDEAFYDVIKLSKTPVIASHSSARYFTPGFERNMDDDMIRELARHGGVIMINFGSTFLNQASSDSYQKLKDARDAYLESHNLKDDEAASDAFTKQYLETTPFTFASLDDVLDHIDHIRNLVGINHVGLGSDFDGVGDSLPIGLKDVSMYPNLVTGLLHRGYRETEIEKILGTNLIRVWKEVEQYASTH